eukprot:gene11291-4102_t
MKILLFICLLLCGLLNAQVQVNWGKCPQIHSTEESEIPSLTPKFDKNLFLSKLECAYTTVPSSWKNPNGKNFTYFVRRLKAENKKGQMWINDGGPGGSANWQIFGQISLYFYELLNREYDIIIPSHRGTGHSSALGCPQEEDENWAQELRNPGNLFQECKDYITNKYGKYLEFYNPTEASRDIYNVAESLRSSANENIVIYGVSYGAFLMNRYMSVYPNSRHLVILDGIASPQYLEFVKYDSEADRVGKINLDLCQRNEFCRSKMKYPKEELEKLFKGYEDSTNHCPEFYKNVPKTQFKAILFGLIAKIPDGLSWVIPPLISRINRCNEFDKKVLSHFFKTIAQKKDLKVDYRANAGLIGFNIGIPELLFNETLPSLEDILKKEETLRFSPRVSILYRIMKDHWFATKQDEFSQKFANTRQPFLLIHGGLDPQTPYSQAPLYFNKVKKTETQYFVSFPYYVHGVIMHIHQNCAQNIMINFMKNPTQKPDESCIKNLPTIDWEGKRELSRQISTHLFSVEDVWAGI